MTTPQNSSSQEKNFLYKKRGLGVLLLLANFLPFIFFGSFFEPPLFEKMLSYFFDIIVKIGKDANNTKLEALRSQFWMFSMFIAWNIAVITLWFANRARVDREHNLNISRQSLNSGRFQKAVEMINEKMLNARLGGLRIIRYLIKERPHEHELKIYNLAIADWLQDWHPHSENERATDQHSKNEREKDKRGIALALFILDKDDKKKFFDRDDERNIGLTPNNYLPKDLSRLDLAAINLSGLDFQGTDLNKTNLSRANLTEAKLQKAKLQKADLTEATLTTAILTEAILRGADLTGADLSGVDLQGAKLQDANLQKANLYATNLQGANLHGANLQKAILSRADLLNVKNLTKEQLASARWDKDNPPLNVPEDLLPMPHDGKPSSDKEDK